MNKLFGPLLIIVLVTLSCNKDELKNNDSLELFAHSIGTKWIYLDSKSDTSYFEYNKNRTINGIDCSELIFFSSLDTNTYYYTQSNDEVYLHAQFVPKTVVDINNPTDTDSLIVLSSPSLEFVYNKQTNYSWMKKILILQLADLFEYEWVEVEVSMEVLGREIVVSPAGTFDCQIIKDENEKYFYVNENGLVKITQQIIINDSTINYENLLIKIE